MTMHDSRCDDPLIRRIRREFLEMPGLRLTPPQAERLWNLDRDTCTDALQRLVEAHILARTEDGRYVFNHSSAPPAGNGPMAEN